MRLIIYEDESYANFYPLALCRPVFELKCGFATLAEKIERRVPHREVAYFCRPVLEPTFRRRTSACVNQASRLTGDDLLLVNGRLLCHDVPLPDRGDSEIALADDQVVYVRITKDRLDRLDTSSLTDLIQSAKEALPSRSIDACLIKYTWDLVLKNAAGLIADFEARGKRGIAATLPEQTAVLGDRKRDVYIAASTNIHPFVCIDASAGPVYIDDDVEVHPFTRIEGPAFIGKGSILLGTKLREGCTIGPTCRIGGEVEESIIHARSNKYHDGFLGHAYVGEWVNLGALTTNSDLKNDYSDVQVTLNGRTIDTGSRKVGSLIGDHVKTSIGTLLNTGSIVGPMALLMATGEPLPKSIPAFAWFVRGVVTKGFGRRKLYETARIAMGRRGVEWTPEDEALWESIHETTRPERDQAVRRGRKQLART